MKGLVVRGTQKVALRAEAWLLKGQAQWRRGCSLTGEALSGLGSAGGQGGRVAYASVVQRGSRKAHDSVRVPRRIVWQPRRCLRATC